MKTRTAALALLLMMSLLVLGYAAVFVIPAQAGIQREGFVFGGGCSGGSGAVGSGCGGDYDDVGKCQGYGYDCQDNDDCQGSDDCPGYDENCTGCAGV